MKDQSNPSTPNQNPSASKSTTPVNSQGGNQEWNKNKETGKSGNQNWDDDQETNPSLKTANTADKSKTGQTDSKTPAYGSNPTSAKTPAPGSPSASTSQSKPGASPTGNTSGKK